MIVWTVVAIRPGCDEVIGVYSSLAWAARDTMKYAQAYDCRYIDRLTFQSYDEINKCGTFCFAPIYYQWSAESYEIKIQGAHLNDLLS